MFFISTNIQYGHMKCMGWLTRIHGDKDATWTDQTYVLSIKVEPGQFGWEGGQDGEDLLGHHWQHLDVDAVELIKARPRSCLFIVDTRKHKQSGKLNNNVYR